MRLEKFAANTVGCVREHSQVAVIRLTQEGSPDAYQTWSAPFPDEATFVREARAVEAELLQVLPARGTTLVYAAFDDAGTVLEQCLVNVTGTSRSRGADNGPVQLAKAMESLARTMDQVCQSAAVQAQQAQKWAEQANARAEAAMHLMQNMQDEKLLVKKLDMDDELRSAVVQQLPVLGEILKTAIKQKAIQ